MSWHFPFWLHVRSPFPFVIAQSEVTMRINQLDDSNSIRLKCVHPIPQVFVSFYHIFVSEEPVERLWFIISLNDPRLSIISTYWLKPHLLGGRCFSTAGICHNIGSGRSNMSVDAFLSLRWWWVLG